MRASAECLPVSCGPRNPARQRPTTRCCGVKARPAAAVRRARGAAGARQKGMGWLTLPTAPVTCSPPVPAFCGSTSRLLRCRWRHPLVPAEKRGGGLAAGLCSKQRVMLFTRGRHVPRVLLDVAVLSAVILLHRCSNEPCCRAASYARRMDTASASGETAGGEFGLQPADGSDTYVHPSIFLKKSHSRALLPQCRAQEPYISWPWNMPPPAHAHPLRPLLSAHFGLIPRRLSLVRSVQFYR